MVEVDGVLEGLRWWRWWRGRCRGAGGSGGLEVLDVGRWRWWRGGIGGGGAGGGVSGGSEASGEAEGWPMARTDRLNVRRARRRYTGRDSIPVGVGLMVQCLQKSGWRRILPYRV